MPDLPTRGTVAADKLKEAVRRLHKAAPQGLTRAELAQAVGLCLRGVDRILAQLRLDGAVIETRAVPGRRTHAYRMSRPPLWDRRISSDTRLALRLAGLALSASGTRQWDGILAVLGGFADERMTDADRLVFQRMERAVRVQGEVEDPIEGEDVLEPLLRALDEHQLVTLDYRAASWEHATRIQVVPYTLVHDLFAGSAFLVAWNPDRRQVLHLRLNRIDRLEPGARRLLGPAALRLLERSATYQVGGWAGDAEPFDVAVRIQGPHWVQALRDAPPPLPDYRFEVEGASLLAHFKATHAAGVLRWVLQFGADAVILSPPALREELAARLAGMTAAYGAEPPGGPRGGPSRPAADAPPLPCGTTKGATHG
jgi:predicted DNA-binding transcriptional regulator YafY